MQVYLLVTRKNPSQVHARDYRVSWGRTTSFFAWTWFFFRRSKPSTTPAKPPGSTSTVLGCKQATSTETRQLHVKAMQALETYLELARLQQASQFLEEDNTERPVGWDVCRAPDLDDLLFGHGSFDGDVAHGDELSAVCEDGVGGFLCVDLADGVEDVFERAGSGDDGGEGGGEVGRTVDDVSRTERLDEFGVGGGCGGDDGGEAGEPGELDG